MEERRRQEEERRKREIEERRKQEMEERRKQEEEAQQRLKEMEAHRREREEFKQKAERLRAERARENDGLFHRRGAFEVEKDWEQQRRRQGLNQDQGRSLMRCSLQQSVLQTVECKKVELKIFGC